MKRQSGTIDKIFCVNGCISSNHKTNNFFKVNGLVRRHSAVKVNSFVNKTRILRCRLRPRETCAQDSSLDCQYSCPNIQIYRIYDKIDSANCKLV